MKPYLSAHNRVDTDIRYSGIYKRLANGIYSKSYSFYYLSGDCNNKSQIEILTNADFSYNSETCFGTRGIEQEIFILYK